MLSAKSEKHAVGATLLFNAAHYALRPWPWIIVALCSLLVFPTLDSLRAAFPHVDPSVLRHDLAYPAMLTFLPHDLLGCFAVYSALFATGYWIYGRHTIANILTVIAVVSTYVLTKAWKRLKLAS